MENVPKKRKKITVSDFLGLDEHDPEDQNFVRFQDLLGGLLHIMVKRGLSQSQLAKKMKISRQAVSDKFSGKNTSMDWIDRACRALGVELRVTFIDRKAA